ncbi:MAG: glutamate 5-kinase [Clostridiales bacterium]|nr:glutamate 5-kinase [Clostridiales bacterium]
MTLYQNRLVIKIGTSTLMNGLGRSDLENIEKITRAVADIQNLGYQIIIVSSGAIAIGANKMKLSDSPKSSMTMRRKQAAAAVGQCSLLFLYDHFFSFYDKTIAQILLSAEDIEHEGKKDNLLKTFDTLLEDEVIPIVNANDSVSVEEILTSELQFGDNDMLSAVVASLCRASKLIVLSDIDAIYIREADGSVSPEPVGTVTDIRSGSPYVASRVSGRGMHEITTKIKAAEYASMKGIDTYIINGRKPETMYDIIRGRNAGTLFAGKK